MKNKILLSLITLFLIGNSYGQKIDKSIINYNFRINSFYDFQVKHDYNYRTFQFTPVFSVEYKKHNFYLGPLYVYFFQPQPIADEIFENNSFGLNIGYRYYSNYLFRDVRLFGQFNYSMYQVKFQQYQLGSPFQTDNKKIIAENTISLGMDFRFIKKLHLFFDFGFGSYNSFFLLFDKFALTSNLGIEYEFNKCPNR